MIAREPIYAALFDLAAGAAGFVTAERRLRHWSDVAPAEQPALFMTQKSEIAAVIGSAFGWRALARQLVGKIPFGAGLVAKAAVAYAGTRVLGLSLDRFYSIGFTYTRAERDRLYTDAFHQGKKIAAKMIAHFRPDLAARYATASSDRVTVMPESFR